ncbi:MAG: dihydrofolate reductase family protein [Gordonia sp. (in: high G+C Gram-positive bacteria)]|uniref:dihydrofolate reductase family protein n=1 Tax=Gordonia TaxID=2053 RepID=UPI003263FB34
MVRANMVASIDGAATADGRSGALGGAGDNAIFHLQRALADVIVVGAQTAVTEGYRPPTVDERYRDLRAATGRADPPPLVLVTRSLGIAPDYTAVADPNVLIATCAKAPAQARERLIDAGATLFDCGTDTVDPQILLDELAARGHRNVLCEGGPRFLAEMTAAGLLDELALTVSPILVGGAAPRIAHGADGSAPMRLRHVLGDDEGYLYQLWERAVGDDAPRSD